MKGTASVLESGQHGLADCMNLGGVTTTFRMDVHVNGGETEAAEKEDGLLCLAAEDFSSSTSSNGQSSTLMRPRQRPL